MIIKTDKDIIQSYFEDHSGLLGGHADRVYLPENENDIIEILKEASQKRNPVTVSGAGTGVAGSRVPFGGSVMSLERMNRILEIKQLSETDAVMTVQPGVTIKDIKDFAAQNGGWMYPPDPTEQNSFIGGNVATNASGSRGFKYGSTRPYIRRLKIILSDGESLDITRGRFFADAGGRIILPLKSGDKAVQLPRYVLPDIKNAAGYYNYPGMDLIDLFIGNEGTLGVISEIEIALKPLTGNIMGGMAFFLQEDAAWNFASDIRTASLHNRIRKLKGINALSLEYFDRHALSLLKEDYPHIPEGAESGDPFLSRKPAGMTKIL